MDLKQYIRDVPDFPTPGILFRDITPLLKHAGAFKDAIDRLAEYCIGLDADVIVGIEARGFVFSAPLAYQLGKPLIPVRKKGKLPFDTHTLRYALEYGFDALEIHTDAIAKNQRVVIVDDLLATGGTVAATAGLVEQAKGRLVGIAVLIELTELGGRHSLEGCDVFSLLKY